MRKVPLCLITLFLLLLFVVPTHGLQKVALPATGEAPEWSTSGEACSLQYYNICTGWVWVWWRFWDQVGSESDRFGTVFESCCGESNQLLITTQWDMAYGPSLAATITYGLTGVAVLYNVDDDDCPSGPPIEQQVWVPEEGRGWNLLSWGTYVPSRFAVIYEISDGWTGWYTNPISPASENGAYTDDGANPAACGTCYPTSRVTHSYIYGTEEDPYCPGVLLDDGSGCKLEWRNLAVVDCTNQVSVEDASWGAIKSLYR